MPTIRTLGLLANAVYDATPSVPGWAVVRRHWAGGHMDGFQAATFSGEGVTVIAFRGTAQAMDGVADLKLGVGMNSTYFSAAETYVADRKGDAKTFICGHSLGGAITQVVANRQGFRFISFNAPGVAVLASRNMGDATVGMTAVRLAGMTASAVRHPFQMGRDVRAAFNVVHGLNVCLQNDLVSKIGVHYGQVMRIGGTSSDPLTEHRMTTMNKVLATNPIGQRDIGSV